MAAAGGREGQRGQGGTSGFIEERKKDNDNRGVERVTIIEGIERV